MIKNYPTFRYVPGTYKRQCDVCGRDFLKSELKKRWDNLYVCDQDYDPKPRFLMKKRTKKSKTIKVV